MAPYKKSEEFEATTFTVNPEPFDVGGLGPLIVQGLICLVLFSGCTFKVVTSTRSSDTLMLTIAWIVTTTVLALGFYIPYRRTRRLRRENAEERAQVKIHAGEADLRVGEYGEGQLVIPYSSLHRLVVRNSLDGEYLGGSTASFVGVGGRGAVGAAAMATTAVLAGAANRTARAHAVRVREYAKVCFQLTAEAAGVSHTLVSGMSEAGAHGLMQELSGAIQERTK